MAVNFKLDLKLIQEWQKKDFRLVVFLLKYPIHIYTANNKLHFLFE
jgi:hypothetical protein